MGIAHLVAAGDAAGKGVFEHTAVQPQDDPANVPGGVLSGSGDSKGNGSRLRHAQGRAHILPDQFCQFVHNFSSLKAPERQCAVRGYCMV